MSDSLEPQQLVDAGLDLAPLPAYIPGIPLGFWTRFEKPIKPDGARLPFVSAHCYALEDYARLSEAEQYEKHFQYFLSQLKPHPWTDNERDALRARWYDSIRRRDAMTNLFNRLRFAAFARPNDRAIHTHLTNAWMFLNIANINRSILYPVLFRINDLPRELLSEIFRMVLASSTHVAAHSSTRLLLASVCRLWRDTILGDSTLYSHIWVDDSPPFPRSVVWLQRARDAPLILNVTDCHRLLLQNRRPYTPAQIRMLTPSLFAKWHSIRNLNLYLRDPNAVMVFLYELCRTASVRTTRRDKSSLLTLSIACPVPGFWDRRMPDEPVIPATANREPISALPFLPALPTLTHLKLDGVPIDWTRSPLLGGGDGGAPSSSIQAPLPGLTSLALHRIPGHAWPRLTDFLAALRASPCLSSLTLDCAGPTIADVYNYAAAAAANAAGGPSVPRNDAPMAVRGHPSIRPNNRRGSKALDASGGPLLLPYLLSLVISNHNDPQYIALLLCYVIRCPAVRELNLAYLCGQGKDYSPVLDALAVCLAPHESVAVAAANAAVNVSRAKSYRQGYDPIPDLTGPQLRILGWNRVHIHMDAGARGFDDALEAATPVVYAPLPLPGSAISAGTNRRPSVNIASGMAADSDVAFGLAASAAPLPPLPAVRASCVRFLRETCARVRYLRITGLDPDDDPNCNGAALWGLDVRGGYTHEGFDGPPVGGSVPLHRQRGTVAIQYGAGRYYSVPGDLAMQSFNSEGGLVSIGPEGITALGVPIQAPAPASFAPASAPVASSQLLRVRVPPRPLALQNVRYLELSRADVPLIRNVLAARARASLAHHSKTSTHKSPASSKKPSPLPIGVPLECVFIRREDNEADPPNPSAPVMLYIPGPSFTQQQNHPQPASQVRGETLLEHPPQAPHAGQPMPVPGQTIPIANQSISVPGQPSFPVPPNHVPVLVEPTVPLRISLGVPPETRISFKRANERLHEEMMCFNGECDERD